MSSILSIAALGRQAKRQPNLLPCAVAGAAFSSIATAIELLLILAISNRELLRYLGPGVVAIGLISALYGLGFHFRSGGAQSPADAVVGRAFEPTYALIFAAAFALMLLLAGLLQSGIGPSAVLVGIALGGFIDTHAATASAARLASAGTLTGHAAALAAMLASSANLLAKMAITVVSGWTKLCAAIMPEPSSDACGVVALLASCEPIQRAVILPASATARMGIGCVRRYGMWCDRRLVVHH